MSASLLGFKQTSGGAVPVLPPLPDNRRAAPVAPSAQAVALPAAAPAAAASSASLAAQQQALNIRPAAPVAAPVARGV